MECFCVLTVASSQVLTYFTNQGVYKCPGSARAELVAVSELATIALVCFHHALEQGVVRFQFCKSCIAQGGCRFLVCIRLASIVAPIITALLHSSLITPLLLPVTF